MAHYELEVPSWMRLSNGLVQVVIFVMMALYLTSYVSTETFVQGMLALHGTLLILCCILLVGIRKVEDAASHNALVKQDIGVPLNDGVDVLDT